MTRINALTRRVFSALTLAGAALLLAACAAGGGGGAAPTDTTTSSSDTISVADVGGQSVLVTTEGLPVYITEEEQASGDVLCVSSGCVEFWPPVVAPSEAPTGNVNGQLGTVTRPDGTEQVTLDGVPLYTFASDSSSSVNGDGLSDSFDGQTLTWHVVPQDGLAGIGSGGGGTQDSRPGY
ncbi:COG4315 family predicted lipoprotein [Gulosibacter molinativorax]|uniref:Lipoprotein with Yx(FWY)xxD motif n=1 Tax=Gulosibacter molinativorax TaxID=256821 RepID=A0ABT7C6S9_9MICO|nr:hypothetical protein [Gulosibacter molinativorax]MDJ1370901.1 hypothetical protein [Gulosibacter molinativorax]QUY62238.1 Hypotetical protein [Gulosibacter molinativorax]